ncbi:hypothetical protein G9A89_012291 [Geosiphon pyriformis]|nr:hypothetical protein G9A89_012291 [Geosiphon pyriformis]
MLTFRSPFLVTWGYLIKSFKPLAAVTIAFSMNSMSQYAETFVSGSISVPIEHRFYPYTDNGGTSLAIAGEDFCVVASDTRQSEGFLINARYSPKAFKLSETAVLATNGFLADGFALVKRLEQRLEWYKHSHNKPMSISALAQMLSTTLYSKRFFPYYVGNLLGGLDENGRGVVYSFDPVGSYKPEVCRAGGSAAALVQPFLDNQVSFKHQPTATRTLSLEMAVKIAKDAFTSATERDIYTGDYLEIFVIKRDGITVEKMELKKD